MGPRREPHRSDAGERLRWRSGAKSLISLRLTLQAPTFELRALGAVTGWSYGDGGDATYDVTVGVLELDGVERGAGEANLLTTAWYAHF